MTRSSPTKSKIKVTRNTAEIAREVCAAIKDVYYDSSKDSFKKRTSDLLNLYKQERDTIINKDEYLTELGYRVDLFLDGAKCQEGQCRVFKLYALLAVRALKELRDDSILDTLVVSIHKKKFNISASIRNSVVALIGRLLHCSVMEPSKRDDPETFYATILPERVFTDLYQILWHVSGDVDEDVRMGVLIALARIQRYPGLMLLVDENRIETTKQLFIMGTRDPSENVRCQAVKGLDIDSNGEARMLLERLFQDDSEEVRIEIAKKLSSAVPVTFFTKTERILLVKSRDLFLADTVIPEYYEILYSWACDLYCCRQGIDFETELTHQQVLSGVYDLLDSFRPSKEIGQIISRLFEHLRIKFFDEAAEDERSYILFAQSFEFDDSPYLNGANYEDLCNIDDNSTGLTALSEKMKSLFMWQTLAEYCCHPALSEATRFECRQFLLPTLSEYAKFIPDIWRTLKAGGEKESEQRVFIYQNICAKSLINIFHSIDREGVGMSQWKEVLLELLVNYEFKYDSELISLIVHDYFYYHYDAQNDPDNALHELTDILIRIGEVGARMNNTQDICVETTQMDMTQMQDISQMPSSQRETSPLATTEPHKRKRCVQVLAAVFKNGFFLQHYTILEGLLTDYAVPIFNNPVDIESRREAFICIAAMAPLLDQNRYNFVKNARLILEDYDNQILELQKSALLLIHDAINVYGYPKVNEWYFSEAENATTSSNNKLINKFVELCDSSDIAFSTFTIRILLRLIAFDHQKIFHEVFVHLLLKLFNPGEDEKIKTLLVFFFTCFCHFSREHQCIMASVFVDAMMKLVNIETDSNFLDVEKDEMVTFVLQITSFNALHPKAIDREKGTAHLYLSARLLTRLEKVLYDKNFTSFFGSMLHKCEVSEIYDEKLFEAVKKGCERLHGMTSDNRLKKFIEAYHKRLESAEKHSKSKKAIERPECIPRSREEIETEFEQIIGRLKVTNEETNNNKRPWLFENISKEDGILAKMKIFGEMHVTFDDIRTKLTGKGSPLFQKPLSDDNDIRPTRPSSTTPRKRGKDPAPAPTTPKTRNNIPPQRTSRRRPFKEKLNTVPEEEDFAD